LNRGGKKTIVPGSKREGHELAMQDNGPLTGSDTKRFKTEKTRKLHSASQPRCFLWVCFSQKSGTGSQEISAARGWENAAALDRKICAKG